MKSLYDSLVEESFKDKIIDTKDKFINNIKNKYHSTKYYLDSLSRKFRRKPKFNGAVDEICEDIFVDMINKISIWNTEENWERYFLNEYKNSNDDRAKNQIKTELFDKIDKYIYTVDGIIDILNLTIFIPSETISSQNIIYHKYVVIRIFKEVLEELIDIAINIKDIQLDVNYFLSVDDALNAFAIAFEQANKQKLW